MRIREKKTMNHHRNLEILSYTETRNLGMDLWRDRSDPFLFDMLKKVLNKLLPKSN